LVKGLGEIAEGNLDARVEGSYNNEFDEIKDTINAMAAGIETYMNDKLHAERAAHESELAKGRAEAAREAVMSGIEYAGKIQKSLLPPDSAFKEAFSDHCCVWKPKDIVGGDIYWIKNFGDGTVLCVCDCTGHGTPGALLTMLVVSTFEAAINDNNYKDTAGIIWELEKRLVAVLNVEERKPGMRGLSINDGCDLAVLYVAKDGSVAVAAGNMHVFVCDGGGVTRFRGQKMRVGDGKLRSKGDIRVTIIPANPNNKFYVASDGLYDQIGGEDALPFGYDALERIILENHGERQSAISDKIWRAFEDYRGNSPRRDDLELIAFQPRMIQ
jgi:serine phosphatase RsbU (regulator of sigma subunit)